MISLPLGRAFKHYTKSASWVIPTGLQECCFATRCRGCPGTSGAPEDAIFDLNGPFGPKRKHLGAEAIDMGAAHRLQSGPIGPREGTL